MRKAVIAVGLLFVSAPASADRCIEYSSKSWVRESEKIRLYPTLRECQREKRVFFCSNLITNSANPAMGGPAGCIPYEDALAIAKRKDRLEDEGQSSEIARPSRQQPAQNAPPRASAPTSQKWEHHPNCRNGACYRIDPDAFEFGSREHAEAVCSAIDEKSGESAFATTYGPNSEFCITNVQAAFAQDPEKKFAEAQSAAAAIKQAAQNSKPPSAGVCPQGWESLISCKTVPVANGAFNHIYCTNNSNYLIDVYECKRGTSDCVWESAPPGEHRINGATYRETTGEKRCSAR
ncbi:hypothetical protein PMI42_01592 [Bradyrhizobium sp. YR681]|uniref:hypothetical protein n=1 Tax=Bradyrhizobium sp. YR681 TaxID=1144344 RepID=UPI00027113E2|nr:hypothetical protein [Bradyrhizobium sp. YR681]EJN14815.1 hypothetical protein PMI42_01592 [Bradyrhizobium sp. YR681]